VSPEKSVSFQRRTKEVGTPETKSEIKQNKTLVEFQNEELTIILNKFLSTNLNKFFPILSIKRKTTF
jgi:hypothetical protein